MLIKKLKTIVFITRDVAELIKFFFCFHYRFKNEVIITCRGGLYVLSAENKLKKIWKSGLFFGADFYENELYLYQDFRHLNFGVIWLIKSGKIKSIFKLVDSGIHQILISNNILYVCNTYKNSLDLYDLKRKILLKKVFPNGSLQNGKSSDNYNHFNSILIAEKLTYLLAHNVSSKSGKSSELYIMEGQKVLKVVPLHMRSAHDLFILDDCLLINDSNGSKGLYDYSNSRTLYNIDGFNRGLGEFMGQIVMGVSEVVVKSLDRDRKPGYIMVLSRKGELQMKFSIDSSPHDIVELSLNEISV